MILRQSVQRGALALTLVTAATASGLLALVACGERIEAGLANAPSLERKSEPRQQYDVIAVGDEGCRNRDGGASVASATDGCKQNEATPLADAAGGPAT
ncbi:MAG TPA: hypothetical protein VII82_06230, partial [Polyangiaceae bacterium]